MAELRTDVMIADVRVAPGDGIETTGRVLRAVLSVTVSVLTTFRQVRR